jgi:hypothetical protein
MEITRALAAAINGHTPASDPGHAKTSSNLTPRDALHVVERQLSAVCKAAADTTQRSRNGEALESAARKFATISSFLAGADSLDDAMAQIQKEQRKQSSNRMRTAEQNTRDSYQKMDQVRQHQKALIKKREEAEKDKGFWDSFCSIFSGIAKAVAAIAKISKAMVAGPLGMVSAAMTVGSLVAGLTGKDVGKIVGMGLDVSAMGTSWLTDSAGEAPAGMTMVDKAVGGLVDPVSGFAMGMAAGYDADRLDAEASITDIAADRKRAMQVIENEQELMREVAEAQAKATKLITSILDSKGKVAKKAIA